MKNLFYIILLLSTFNVSAQVKFENISLNDAIAKAAVSGKIILIQFESVSCFECNEVADKGLSDKNFPIKIADGFVALKITANHPDRQDFSAKYNPRQAFGTYFISSDGELLHVYPGSASIADKYLTEIEKAYSKLNEGKVTLAELDNEWRNNPKNIAAMEANLTKRSSLGLPTDSLLDVYVKRLPNDSFYSQRTIVFILKQAPSLFSKANSKIKNDQTFYSTAWYTLSLSDRININNRIAFKSMKIAIDEKSRNKAMIVADFHAGTHTDRFSKAASKTYNKKMLDYFIGIKDTTNYLKKAVDYYDSFYMDEPLSKIQQQDSLARIKAMQNSTIQNVKIVDPATDKLAKTLDSLAPERRMKPLNMDDPKDVALKKMIDSVVTASRMNRSQNSEGIPTRRVAAQQSFTYAPTTQFYANDLNSGAWLVYTSTSDKKYLTKALAWAKRATEAFESPEVMDTYARILYKTGDQQQAIEVLQKAVVIVKERQRNSVPRFEAVLNKMKAGLELY
jgi:tetratricopeptide (TPR) repeat protein